MLQVWRERTHIPLYSSHPISCKLCLYWSLLLWACYYLLVDKGFREVDICIYNFLWILFLLFHVSNCHTCTLPHYKLHSCSLIKVDTVEHYKKKKTCLKFCVFLWKKAHQCKFRVFIRINSKLKSRSSESSSSHSILTLKNKVHKINITFKSNAY